ncbi:MAG: EpsG family protein [Clostridia bacterium]|nr:EpsG family protein [Clostridia bacterium]
MLVYVSVAIAIILIGVLFYRKEKPSRGMWFLFLVLVVVSGIRGEMSTDHPEYNNIFQRLAQMDFSEVLSRNFNVETGFVVLSKIISYISRSEVFYATVIAFLTMGFSFMAYGKRSKIPWLSVLLFFSVGEFFDSFNLIRQILAVAICFFATKYINKNKKDFFKYMALVLLASAFHTTAAIVMIPAYFILKTRFTSKSIFVYAGAGALIYVLFPRVLPIFTKLFPQYNLDIYGNYVDSTANFNSIIPILGVTLFVIVSVFIFDVEFDMDNYENRVAMNGLALLTMFAPLGLQMAMAARISLYFRPFIALTAVNVIANFKSSKNKEIVISAVSVVAILFIIIVLRESPYNPYYVHPEVIDFFR